jgi:hypothetical protein
MRRTGFLGALGVLLVLVGGCNPKPETPAPEAVATKPPAPRGPGEPEKVLESLDSLGPNGPEKFAVRAEKQDPKVAQHYERVMAAAGWKPLKPKTELDPQRKWKTLPHNAGPTDLYDAGWVNPKTGQTAVLQLWHTGTHPDLQEGLFEVRAKGE